MDRFCSRCGMRITDDAAPDCPNCHAPLGVLSGAPAASVGSLCTVCGRAVPAEQLITYRDQRVCPECKPGFFQKLREGVPGGPSGVPQEPAIPFEAAPGIGSFFATLKLFMSAPLKTMRGQRTGEGLEAAVVFWLVIQIPVQFIARLEAWGMQNIMPRQPQPQLPSDTPPALQQLMDMSQALQHASLALHLGFAAAAVIFGVLGIFIYSGLIHFYLRLLGGGGQGYRTTVKAVCYASAPAILAIIPCCGPFVGGGWHLVLQFMLIGPAHREDVGKGALAALFALLTLCVCLCGMYAVGGAAAFAWLAGHAR